MSAAIQLQFFMGQAVNHSVIIVKVKWISQKQCKLGSPNLHRRLPGRL